MREIRGLLLVSFLLLYKGTLEISLYEDELYVFVFESVSRSPFFRRATFKRFDFECHYPLLPRLVLA